MENKKENPSAQANDDTVYVLEGEPDEVFNAQGERIQLTPQQEEYIEDHE